MKKITFLLFAFIFSNHLTIQAQNIVINEVLASNTASIQDEDSSHQDWIELYNNTDSVISLYAFS